MKIVLVTIILTMALGAVAANAWPLPTCGNFICPPIGH